MTIFDAIKQKLSIVEVVSSYVSLKKAGIYWKGRCPFHKEKTPSFTVSPHKQIFYCFGCHATGDAIGFIAQIEQYSQLEAAQELIKQYQLPIDAASVDDPASKQLKQKQQFFLLNYYVSKWCHYCLQKNTEAATYLEQRHISQDMILKFHIGYWPAGQPALAQLINFVKQYNFTQEDLVKYGLLYRSSYGLRSAFADRIIFPIRDYLGNICGFGGRTFKKHDKRVKYYNSREQQYFNKGSLLYGLDVAKKAIAQAGFAFVVEGYTDLLALVQQGYANTVATLGTACTQEHLELVRRYAQKIYITFDGDAAGNHALMSVVNKCWQVAIDPYVITLPEKDDPASLLIKNMPFKTYVEQAQDIFIFFIKQRAAQLTHASFSEKLHAIQDILLLIKRIPDKIKQDILLHKAAQTLSISLNNLQQALQEIDNTRHQKQITQYHTHKQQTNMKKITLLEKKLFSAILFSNSSLTKTDISVICSWLSKPLNLLADKAIAAQKQEVIQSLDCLGSEFSDLEKGLINQVVLEAEQYALFSLQDALKEFYKKQWKIVIQNIKLKIKEAEQAQDTARVQQLLNDLIKFKQEMAKKGIV